MLWGPRCLQHDNKSLLPEGFKEVVFSSRFQLFSENGLKKELCKRDTWRWGFHLAPAQNPPSQIWPQFAMGRQASASQNPGAKLSGGEQKKGPGWGAFNKVLNA